MEIMKKLEGIAAEASRLGSHYNKLEWTEYTTAFDFGLEEAHEKLTEVYKNEKNYELICKAVQADLDPVEKRKAEIMYKEFKPYHLSKEVNELEAEIQKKASELSRILNTHRTQLNGKEISDVALTQILSNDEDEERRKAAFLARTQVNKPLVDGGFIELINMRKEYAKLLGEKDFVELKLKEDDLDISIFNGWGKQLKDMQPKMNSKRIEYAQKYLNKDKIMPWDEMYISSRIAPSLNSKVSMSEYYEVILRFFKKFGIDISKFNITYDIFSRANKSEWGYNFEIETAKDSRILANVKDQYFEYDVLLHETGHGIHSFLLNEKDTILNNGVSGIISEGIANLFGHFIYEKAFYEKFFAASELDGITEEFENIKTFKKINALRAIPTIFFDQELYRNNISSLEDIYQLYWKVNKDMLGEEPYGAEAPWGYRIHHTSHPIYLHNYFMGDVTCEMLSKVFNKKNDTKSILEKPLEFGEFLISEVIHPSGLYKYGELFKKISGEDFSLKYIV